MVVKRSYDTLELLASKPDSKRRRVGKKQSHEIVGSTSHMNPIPFRIHPFTHGC